MLGVTWRLAPPVAAELLQRVKRLAIFQVCYPKPTDKGLYNGLVTQAKSLGLAMPDWPKIQVDKTG
jgi:hypothetical protein